mmetsp:Transcript_31496/g.121931  ORF Transcript_31496/g.121931 Transcript_31496/m.121931 type:complete len:118 (-) Transcript_31496:3552-3905(-)
MSVRPKSVAQLEDICSTEVDEHAGDSIRAPMPGSVTSVLISDGDKVEPEQELLVLEAMKMQNILRSNKRAEVKVRLMSKFEFIEFGPYADSDVLNPNFLERRKCIVSQVISYRMTPC